MKVGVQTWGSEGDLRPFFALAQGLAKAGHEVSLQYSGLDDKDHSGLLAGAAFAHRKVGTLGLSQDEITALGARVFSDSNPVRQMDSIFKLLLDPVIPAMTEGALELAETSEVMIHHMIAHPAAAAAEKLKRPLVVILPAPMIATRDFPMPGAPDLGFLNAWGWKLALSLLDKRFLPSVARTRATLGLPAIRRVREQADRSVLELCTVSPTLMPRPDDWPAKAHVTGFLNLAATGQAAVLPERLEAFLAAGEPPVFVTFGSMTWVERDPVGLFKTVVEAIDAVGCRAIVQTGATVLADHPRILSIGPVPHDVVFPRCAAIVHHGGAGTTQASLRAGRPSVVVAHFGDQFLWGTLLLRHGVGPPHVKRKGLTAKALAPAIEAALAESEMPILAAEMGAKMRAEDGVATAVKLIESIR